MTQRRFGNIQLFARGVSKDDGRYDGLQQGIITYDENDNYQVSYLELGVRCDHIGEKINSSTSSRIASSDPLECDADLMVAKSVAPVATDSQVLVAGTNGAVPMDCTPEVVAQLAA